MKLYKKISIKQLRKPVIFLLIVTDLHSTLLYFILMTDSFYSNKVLLNFILSFFFTAVRLLQNRLRDITFLSGLLANVSPDTFIRLSLPTFPITHFLYLSVNPSVKHPVSLYLFLCLYFVCLSISLTYTQLLCLSSKYAYDQTPIP